MTDVHEQLHVSLRISEFASLLCAGVKYPPRSILEILLWYPKNRNSKLIFSGAAIPNIYDV